MKSIKFPILYLVFGGVLVSILALSGPLPEKPSPIDTSLSKTSLVTPTPEYPMVLESQNAENEIPWMDLSPQEDLQGAVSVEVTPINLHNPDETLLFDITLNTHSVDLSMDLASLSTLVTDNGLTIKGTLWDAPIGGHHVSGVLSFVILESDRSLFNNANQLTLIIRDLDAVSRLFNWEK